MKRVHLQPAYVLHRRPYRETSFLVDLFTPEYGRLTAIAKGVRKAKSTLSGLLQPFTPLLVSWVGKGDLMILTHAEPSGGFLTLRGPCLFAGFYLNELLTVLTERWDPHPQLYAKYSLTLSALQNPPLEERILRSFEKNLLAELGYGLPVSEHTSQQKIDPTRLYRFIPEQGFIPCNETQGEAAQDIFRGESLLAIDKEDWQNERYLQDAKRLMRFILMPLLGDRPIYSRRLFM